MKEKWKINLQPQLPTPVIDMFATATSFPRQSRLIFTKSQTFIQCLDFPGDATTKLTYQSSEHVGVSFRFLDLTERWFSFGWLPCINDKAAEWYLLVKKQRVWLCQWISGLISQRTVTLAECYFYWAVYEIGFEIYINLKQTTRL